MRHTRLVDALTWRSLEAAKRADVGLRKSCSEDEPETCDANMVATLSARGLKSSGEEVERTVLFTISNEGRDRDGDRIKAKGFDLKNYRKNPVVLYAHDYRSFGSDGSITVIGKSIDVWVDNDGKGGPRLRALKQFATKDENPLADTVFRMIKGKYLRAASVGFKPIDWIEDPEGKDAAGGMFNGYLFNKVELLESSIVPVPSNPQALEEARSVGGIDLAPIAEWAEQVLDTTKGAGFWLSRSDLEAAHRLSSVSKTIFAPQAAPIAPIEEPIAPQAEEPVAQPEVIAAPATELAPASEPAIAPEDEAPAPACEPEPTPASEPVDEPPSSGEPLMLEIADDIFTKDDADDFIEIEGLDATIEIDPAVLRSVFREVFSDTQ